MTIPQDGGVNMEEEAKKDIAKKCKEHLTFLRGIAQEKIAKLEQFLDGSMSSDVLKQELENNIGSIMGIHTDLDRFGLEQYVSHDSGAIIGEVVSQLELLIYLLGDDKNSADAQTVASTIFRAWPRYRVAIGDILLRGMSQTEVPREFLEKGVDLTVFNGALTYLLGDELKRMRRTKGKGYDNLNTKNITVVPEHIEDLNQRLVGRTIQGNTSVVSNFVLNEMRNDFRDRTEADTVTLSMDVEGDEFVIRIIDDGKGMNSEHLEREHLLNVEARNNQQHTYYIFDAGASGEAGDATDVKSTGLGLAHAPERFSSMGGKLSVYTKRKESGLTTGFPPSKEGEEHPLAKALQSDHGTIFEIRLPLTTSTITK